MNICPVCQRCYDDSARFCLQQSHSRLVAARLGSREIVSGYRLNSLLEQDGISEIYEAVRLADNKIFVIRILSAKFQAEIQNLRDSFLEEARTLAAVRDSNIVGVCDSGVLANGEFYTIAKSVDGETLRRYQAEKQTFSEIEAILIVRQLAEALGAAHRAGIAHRALNPANVIIEFDENNQPTAGIQNFDLGGVRQKIITADKLFDEPNADWRLEAFKYLAPEQCALENSDYRSDIYSLGVLLYELLGGAPPFAAETVAALAEKQQNDAPPPLESLRFDIKEMLAHELMQTLKKNPLARPQTAARFVSSLNHIEQVATQPLSSLEKFLQTKAGSQSTANAVQAPAAAPSFKSILDEKIKKAQPAKHNIEKASLATSKWFESVLQTTGSKIEEKTEGKVFLVPEKKEITVAEVADKPKTTLPEAITAIIQPSPQAETRLSAEKTAEAEQKTPTTLTLSDAEIDAMLDKAGTPEGFSTVPTPRRTSRSFVGIAALLLIFAVLGTTAVAAVWYFQPLNIFNNNPEPLVQAEKPSGEQNSSPETVTTEGVQPPAETISNAPSQTATNVGEVDDVQSGGQVQRGNKRGASANNPVVKTQTELNSSLVNWLAATKARDVNKQMNFYAPKVETYYRTRNATPEIIRAEKMRIFGGATIIDIQTAQTEITVNPDGSRATMRFRKKYAIKKGQKTQKGEVMQELQWIKTGSNWKIVSERDLKTIG